MAAAITVDFDSNPHSVNVVVGGTAQVRFWDKSSTNNGVVNFWLWILYDSRAWTVSTPPSTHLNLANASTYFAVNDQVCLSTSALDLPSGLAGTPTSYYVVTATSTYLEISATEGGAAVQYTDAGTGTFYVQHVSTHQNGIIPLRSLAAGAYNCALMCNDSGMTGDTSTTKNGWLIVNTTSYSKPTNGGIFGRITIFIYDSTNATAINRLKSTNNNLFFQNLKCTSSITKAGTATFTVYNAGGATATEIGLLVADKNVAIISGRDVIWSGKISRAVQAKMSLFDTASPFMSWNVECDSDIAKMRYQNVKTANQTAYNAPPGYIINKLVEPAVAGDIDWRGAVNPSLISFEGANIPYTISNADMYSQFLTLANLTGFDWRTRNDWVKYAYGASGYSAGAKTVTVAAIAPYTTNSFAGMWLLFVNNLNADATTNTIGVQAYGNIASNTTTVITLTSITNSSIPPASSDDVIILGNPVLDFSSDLRQPTYVSTFTMNKARASTLQNGYEMNDLSDFKTIITQAIAKAKDVVLDTMNFVPISATTLWDNVALFFSHASFITFKTEGWVKSGAATTSDVYIYGWDYALQVNDDVDICYYDTAGTLTVESFHVHAVAEEYDDANNKVTKVTLNVAMTHTFPVGTFLTCRKLYFKDTTGLNTGGENRVGAENITLRAGGTDAIYGAYLTTNGTSDRGDSSTRIYPHTVGCIAIDDTYTVSAPETDSPVKLFGVIRQTMTADQRVSLSDLDVYATNYLINHSFYYRKGTFWAFVYDWFKPDIRAANEVSENGWLRAGDEICVLQHTGDTATDLEYGQYKNQWQIVGWTLDADQMTVSVELGDFERNTNTLINDKTSGINYTIT